MGEEIVGFLLSIGLLTLVMAVIIYAIYHFVIVATRRTQSARASDEAYRQLAREATEAQQRTADELAELRQRMERIEKVLSEVE